MASAISFTSMSLVSQSCKSVICLHGFYLPGFPGREERETDVKGENSQVVWWGWYLKNSIYRNSSHLFVVFILF